MQNYPSDIPRYTYRERRRRWRGCSSCLLIVIVSCCFLMVSAGVFYTAAPPVPINILILGDDSRPGEAAGELARTDSIMVLRIDPEDNQISLLSIPRDLYLESPQFGPMRANVVIRNAELNESGSGVGEMQSTVENTFDIEIDYTARLSFTAFVDLIDAVDGVEIDVPKRIIDYTYPTDDGGTMTVEFEPGVQTMDGQQALIYARTRHADDDYQRAGRQQQVMEALFKKLSNPRYADHWPAVLGVIQDNIQTNMNTGTMLLYAPLIMRDGRNPEMIERRVIDRENVIYRGDQAHPDMSKLTPWLDKYLR